MENNNAFSTSVWQSELKTSSFKPLRENIRTDVCIIGGGIAGLTCGYLMTREPREVVLLESGSFLTESESSRTTAHLSNIIDWGYDKIGSLHSPETARLVAESHTAALKKIQDIVTENNIPCDLQEVDGYLFLLPGSPYEKLEKELIALQQSGLVSVEKIQQLPWPFFESGPALRLKNQAQFHPVKYMNALARLIQEAGGEIFTSSHVSHFDTENELTVTTNEGFTVKANALVIATNTPINDRVIIHTKQAAYRTYVIGVSVPKDSIPSGLYWEKPASDDPFHYIRLEKDSHADHDILIVGGEDHKTGQADDAEQRYESLEKWARGIFPMIQSIDFRWSGQIMQSCDGLAFIGHNPADKSNTYIVTADCGTGMTYGTIAGMLLTDLICERKNRWEEIYNPARKTLRAAWNFTRENSNVVWQYADWFTTGQLSSFEKIRPGRGAIIREGLHKLAIYRDENNALHTHSAVCPHLGGIVKWNSGEKTWDCPCHGSRFDCYGKVIHGPALSDLSAATSPGEKELQVPAKKSY